MYVDEIRAYTPQNEQEAADQRLILEYIRLFPDNILTRSWTDGRSRCPG